MASGTMECGAKVKMKLYVLGNISLTANTPYTAEFQLPDDFHKSYGASIVRAWPVSTWANAQVAMAQDNTVDTATGSVVLLSPSTQTFDVKILLLYI